MQAVAVLTWSTASSSLAGSWASARIHAVVIFGDAARMMYSRAWALYLRAWAFRARARAFGARAWA
eukprot:6194208-Pleurochrysis_carterae.AAC.3